MVNKIPSGHKKGKSKGVCIRKGINKKIAQAICKIIICGNLEDANAEEANVLFWKKRRHYSWMQSNTFSTVSKIIECNSFRGPCSSVYGRTIFYTELLQFLTFQLHQDCGQTTLPWLRKFKKATQILNMGTCYQICDLSG